MTEEQLAIDLEAPLWQLAQDARWFSGRSRGGRPAGVEFGPWLTPTGADPGARSAVLVVAYPGGERERYHVPLAFRPPAGAVAPELARVSLDGTELAVGELCDDPDAAGLLLAGLAAGAQGFVAFRDDVPTGLLPRRYGGEQSNTTLFFGDALLCKVFRRLEDGPNVDVELHVELAGSGTVAECYGAWREADVDLGVFLQAFADPTDGYVAASRAADEGTDFTAEARRLGATLAHVHGVLAERLGTDTADPAAMAEVFRRRFDVAAAEVADLEPFRDTVVAVYDAVAGEAVVTQRIHGDCHLGQVLLTGGDWRYVDFEGEPLKTLDERRERDTPWRDVAGMLRSFDYAAATAADGAPAWRLAARDAFLAGYGGEAGRDLLRALEVDKAVYEVVYETRNRPGFRHIPLDFLGSVRGAQPWHTTSSAD